MTTKKLDIAAVCSGISGHCNTVVFYAGSDCPVPVDKGFIVFNKTSLHRDKHAVSSTRLYRHKPAEQSFSRIKGKSISLIKADKELSR